MPERKLIVEIVGDERSLRRSFLKSEAAGQRFEARMTGVSRGIRKSFAAIGLAVGAASVGVAIRSTIQAATDFESSFAGVRKTVDATEPQLLALAEGFRAMAREIPVGVNELNRIGEAAGQLGIERESILGFTRTIADLGQTTNLSVDQAATSLARLANITGLPQSKFDQLGSAIVELGNKLATTEAEIVDFGLRLAGAGKQVGLTEAQILAIGGAFSSVGVSAEAGGTSVSKVLLSIQSAVLSGGRDLQKFAAVAGTSAAEFQKAFRDDAGAAFTDFVEGLDRIRSSGGNAFEVLSDLGLTDQRLVRAFLSAAGAGDLLARSLSLAEGAFRTNSALTEEAGKRYETTASRLQLFQNRVNDLKIGIGTGLIPVLLNVVEPLSEWLANTENQRKVTDALNGVLRDATAVIKGVAAVVVPLAQGTRDLVERMGGLQRVVKVLLAALVVSKIAGFATAITAVGVQAEASTVRVNALRVSLARLAKVGAIIITVEVLLSLRGSERWNRFWKGVDERLVSVGNFLESGGGPAAAAGAALKFLANLDLQVRETNLNVDKLARSGLDAKTKIEDALASAPRAPGKSTATAATGKASQETVTAGIEAILAGIETAAKAVKQRAGKVKQRLRTVFENLVQELELAVNEAGLTRGIGDDIAALRKLQTAILNQIRVEGRTIDLANQLVDVRSRIAGLLGRQASGSADAFRGVLDRLGLNLEKARVTVSLQDDLRELARIEDVIVAQIRTEGRTSDLLSELFRVRQERADAIRQQAVRQRDARKASQFKALGLTDTGDERIPGVEGLRRQLGGLDRALEGTFLDTRKTESVLTKIRRVLSGGLGEIGRDVRAKIQQILADLNRQLKDNQTGPLTRFRVTNTDQVLSGVGLDEQTFKTLRQRLARLGPGGTTPFQSRTGGAFGFAPATAGGGNTFVTIQGDVHSNDGEKWIREVEKRAQRTKGTRSGVFAGGGRGI